MLVLFSESIYIFFENVLLKNPSVKKKVGSYLKELAVSAPHGTTAGAMKVTAKLECFRESSEFMCLVTRE